MLPLLVAKGIATGRKPGEEMAQLTDKYKHQGSAPGVFTTDLLSRTSLYHQAIILALCPFHNTLYEDRSNFAASQSVNA